MFEQTASSPAERAQHVKKLSCQQQADTNRTTQENHSRQGTFSRKRLPDKAAGASPRRLLPPWAVQAQCMQLSMLSHLCTLLRLAL